MYSDDWSDGYVAGWALGFLSAVAAVYLIRKYFPDIIEPAYKVRVLTITKEDRADAASGASDGMARSGETRTDS